MDGTRPDPRAQEKTCPLAACGNRLIGAMREADRALLEPHLVPVDLAPRQVLFEAGEEIAFSHFPCAGTVISLAGAMSDGRVAEVAVIGAEGAAGGIISAGRHFASARAEVQVPGPALRIDIARLEAAKAASAPLRGLLARYADLLLAQVMQSAACNALHPVEARACRWLLMIHDRAGTDELPLTQEFLAEMLGVQRTTVTRVLAGLAEARALDQRRGCIVLRDRRPIERGACECYRAVERHVRRIAPELLPGGAGEAANNRG
ncbi:transcriptional regulator [Caldovatus sediminis]|uniref:Transcriptional regulator n=1 Tax=Caldovatus sediminis TaxID=2041189 RepID=A0A8J2Z866_9PROT|nr:Crp/Fnr family transcriptional regulator [Caldovatus sediminis]GGG18978.1 transcriptional regulator [Caldovatus sediminis]